MGQIKNIKLHIVTDIKSFNSHPTNNKDGLQKIHPCWSCCFRCQWQICRKTGCRCYIVDHSRALCENPVHGVPRQVFRFQDLNITDIAVKIPNGARGGAIRKQYTADDVDAQWEKTAWAKK